MTAAEAYAELVRRTGEAATLASASALLSWDQETYMPSGGGEHRGRQLALLAGLTHDRRTDPRIGELLDRCTMPAETPEAADLREWRRGYDRAAKLPRRLVEELAETTSHAQQEWSAARTANDFPRFAPWLSKVLALKREEAAAIGGGACAYDVLLDEFEPGAAVATLQPMFADLRERLAKLVQEVRQAPKQPNLDVLKGDFPIAAQEAFGKQAAADFGFDFSRGRLDVTAHPFCTTIGPGDVRLTTRSRPECFGDGFFSILHETGHGLYEQGLPAERYGRPTGDAASLGVHESQSRLWENFVGRSAAFWAGRFAQLQEAFPAFGGAKLDPFVHAVNAVAPSFIRVDADEATYNLHVLLRFELEQELIADKLPIADLPAAWNERMQRLLGVTPPDDRRGCLQDVHWSCGLVGYFPTYTLGNLAAAQLFHAADRALGGLEPLLRRGDFRPLLDWLRTNVHAHGQRWRPAELLRRATGQTLSAEALLAALRGKYAPLYGL